MAKTNVRTTQLKTHEGGTAKAITPWLQLRRSVLSCMLWEDTFYESGKSIAERIQELVPQVEGHQAASLAKEARGPMKLRHVPLLIAREMARTDKQKVWVGETLAEIIQRPDELAEFLSIYWMDGRQPLSNQVKLGLASAFTKFDEYQLAKYDRKATVKLRDVLFLCHAKPKNKAQKEMWQRLIEGKLATPDTWEVALSKGEESKHDAWTRLLKENKMGALALLRNLRNMDHAQVDRELIRTALNKMKTDRVLPFRFISAARHAPWLEKEIDDAFLRSFAKAEKFEGNTVILVDVSGSMDSAISAKTEVDRMDAACGIAMAARELCDDECTVYSFSFDAKLIPARRGMALRDAIINSQAHGGTYLGGALASISMRHRGERVIVITDEQAHDTVPDPTWKGYMINVAAYKNGVGYGAWTHIDGFSERVLDFIMELEKLENSSE